MENRIAERKPACLLRIESPRMLSRMSDLSGSALSKILIALAVYITALLASNTLGLKIMPLPFGIHLSVGIFTFPIVFLMTDVVGELYGKKLARTFVLSGSIATALFLFVSFLSLSMPWAAAGEWVHASYDTVFGMSMRIALASLAAFVIGEYQDVFTFFLFRDLWQSRFFWLRSMLSGLWSQFLDTVIFMLIAFYGVYADTELFWLIVSWWLFKVIMGMLYSPLLYVGLWLLRDTGTQDA